MLSCSLALSRFNYLACLPRPLAHARSAICRSDGVRQLLLGGGGYVVYRQKFSYKAVINNGTYDNPSYDAYSNKLLD